MKVGLLAYYLSSIHSGQTRFLMNLAKGLKSIGHDPIVYSIYIDKLMLEELKTHNITVHHFGDSPSAIYKFSMMTYANRLGSKLASIVMENNDCDCYVILADEAVPAVASLQNVKLAYITQGDWNLMLLNSGFTKAHRFTSSFMETRFVPQMRRHSKLVSMFDLVMANSRFTANLMAFIYGLPINKVVYPPVDIQLFNRQTRGSNLDSKYAVAIVRNPSDPMYRPVSELAQRVRIMTAGGGMVLGGENLGFVSDKELVRLYSDATINLSPNPLEFYGYSIVEAMSCGTPTIAYDNGGAQELIKPGITGWLASDGKEMKERVIDIIEHGYDENIRKNCQIEAQRFSTISSAKSLVSHLARI